MRRLMMVLLGSALAFSGCTLSGAGGYNMVRLREACVGFAENDSQIEGLIVRFEDYMDQGATKTDALAVVASSCGGPSPGISLACATCGTAVVDEVWP